MRKSAGGKRASIPRGSNLAWRTHGTANEAIRSYDRPLLRGLQRNSMLALCDGGDDEDDGGDDGDDEDDGGGE